MEPYYEADGLTLYHGNCVEVMACLPADSFDSCVTDPPYGLEFMGKEWDAPWKGDVRQPGDEGFVKGTGAYGRAKVRHGGTAAYAAGEMALGSFQEWCRLWAVEVLRVLKPGAHLLAFGGTRTYHRLACAIEDAGFEIRDQIGWAFGQGFPKSRNLDGDWQGWGTALKPAWEPIVVARKPLTGTVAENVAKHGTGAMNIDGCRIETDEPTEERDGEATADERYTGDGSTNFAAKPGKRRGRPLRIPGHKPGFGDVGVSAGSVAAGETTLGRWPANLIHDGSPEVLACFPDTASGQPNGIKAGGKLNCYGTFAGGVPVTGFGDAGSAARFFYCAKADRTDRNEGCEKLERKAVATLNAMGDEPDGEIDPVFARFTTEKQNHHPTVKPTDLMRYLLRLVTPPGGLVLEPFAGSGTTLKAAHRENFRCVGIEREAGYVEIAKARLMFERNKTPLFGADEP